MYLWTRRPNLKDDNGGGLATDDHSLYLILWLAPQDVMTPGYI